MPEKKYKIMKITLLLLLIFIILMFCIPVEMDVETCYQCISTNKYSPCYMGLINQLMSVSNRKKNPFRIIKCVKPENKFCIASYSINVNFSQVFRGCVSSVINGIENRRTHTSLSLSNGYLYVPIDKINEHYYYFVCGKNICNTHVIF